MLIINADDWGGWKQATDAAHACYRKGTANSVSAMVFMADSERAAEIANAEKMEVGLHLNFTQPFTGGTPSDRVREYQERTRRFLTRSKYALLFYHPFLREEFRYLYFAQMDEFVR